VTITKGQYADAAPHLQADEKAFEQNANQMGGRTPASDIPKKQTGDFNDDHAGITDHKTA
jgi:hypothetical protein